MLNCVYSNTAIDADIAYFKEKQTIAFLKNVNSMFLLLKQNLPLGFKQTKVILYFV